jgi:hypothetical protein
MFRSLASIVKAPYLYTQGGTSKTRCELFSGTVAWHAGQHFSQNNPLMRRLIM